MYRLLEMERSWVTLATLLGVAATLWGFTNLIHLFVSFIDTRLMGNRRERMKVFELGIPYWVASRWVSIWIIKEVAGEAMSEAYGDLPTAQLILVVLVFGSIWAIFMELLDRIIHRVMTRSRTQ